MPQFIGNILAVSKEELVPAYWPSYDALKKALQRAERKGYGIERAQRGGGAETQLFVKYDSLPADIAAELPDLRRREHPMQDFYKIDGKAVSFYDAHTFADGSEISDDAKQKYVINASVLMACIRLRDVRVAMRMTLSNKKGGNLMESIWKDATSFNDILAKHEGIRHTLPENDRRFKELFKRFEAEGYEVLVSKKHGNQAARKVFDHTLELLRNLFADKMVKPTVAEIHRQYEAFLGGYIDVVNNETGEAYAPTNFKPLSEATIKNYLAAWVSRIATDQIRTDNRQNKMGKFKPYYSFEMPKLAGSILSIDDRQPIFHTLEGKRIWFYMGVDVASRAFTCWVHGDTKEGIIIEFYRQMVRNYAEWGFELPAELECEMSLNASYRDSFLMEGKMFDFVKMEANNARGKYIERVFGEVRYRKEKGREGWLARPHARSESNQAGIELAKVKRLPYERIVRECLTDIEDWNNEPHPTEAGLSRWEYFTQKQNKMLKPTNYKAFIKHIGYKEESSCNVGNVRFRNDLFLIAQDGEVSRGEHLIKCMKEIECKDITIYWLDDNQGEVLKAYAYHRDEFVCELVRKPRPNRARIERTNDDVTKEAILAAYTNTVDNFGKKQIAAIDRVTVIDNRTKPTRNFKITELYTRGEKPQPIRPNNPTEWPDVEILDDVDDMEAVYTPSPQSLRDRY